MDWIQCNFWFIQLYSLEINSGDLESIDLNGMWNDMGKELKNYSWIWTDTQTFFFVSHLKQFPEINSKLGQKSWTKKIYKEKIGFLMEER